MIIFNKQYSQLGYLTTNAKYYLYANSSGYTDLIETYLLFGDPALKLQTLPVALPAPTNLQAAAVSSTQIDLTWQDNSSNETEFRIERSPDGSTGWTQIASVAADVTSYSDIGLSCAAPYYYRLRAYRAGDNLASDYTNIANAAAYACQTISFNPGWNLITLPLQPVTAFDSETLLQAINSGGSDCNEIARWAAGQWESYPLGMPFGQFPIDLGQGYFIKCTAPRSWTMEGTALTSSVSLSLSPGWSLIGIPYPASGNTAMSVVDGINIQGGNCSELVRWLNGTWETYINGVPFTDFAILPYAGYFVKCTTASAYTP